MGRVFDQGDAMLVADALNFLQVGRDDSAHVHQHDRFRVRSDLAAKIIGIHLKVFSLAVDKDHPGAGMNRCHGGRDESVTGHNDGRPFDVDRAQDHLQRTRPGGRAEGIPYSAIHRPLALELSNVAPHADEAGLQVPTGGGYHLHLFQLDSENPNQPPASSVCSELMRKDVCR